MQTTEISKRYVDLHAEYADYIYEAMQASVEDGTPVVAPLWWADPNDNETFAIWDGKKRWLVVLQFQHLSSIGIR